MNNFTVAAVFSDHMVLQRNKYISIFGEGNNSSPVTASLFDYNGNLLFRNSTVIDKGLWLVELEPQKAQNGCVLKITNENTVLSFSDIAIGEVWLAGGQSNMEFELQNCTEGPAELEDSAAGKNVRFYYTNKIAWMDDHFFEAERNTCWQTWDSPAKGAWSAVGYFFAKKLAEDLGCTVGVIGCNWGGTSASAWMRREYLEADRDLNTYLTDYEEAVRGKSIEQQCKEYDDYETENAKWQEAFSKLWEKQPGITWEEAEKVLGKNPWPGPASCKNPYRPTGLYDCMVARIIPYTLKGVLWYQGEDNVPRYGYYAELLKRMVEGWRSEWKQGDFPFYFCQIAPYDYSIVKWKDSQYLREQQQKAEEIIPNARMAVLMDTGLEYGIHPRKKRQAGERLAMLALSHTYDVKGLPEYARYSSVEFRNDTAVVAFDRSKEWVYFEHGTTSKNFEIAGNDRVFHPATKVWIARNRVYVLCDAVKQPAAVRYAFHDWAEGDLMHDGLPVSSFRTDSW